MRPFKQSMLVVIVAVGLLGPAVDFAQSPNPSPSTDILLEVVATHSTMAGDDTYLYLRVFSDGTAECHSSAHAEKEPRRFKKTLTQDDFSRIKSIVGNKKLANLRSRYETQYAIVDTSTEWTIKIQRPRQAQIIQILEFSPGLAKTMKHPYPDALVRLGCNIEKLRAHVDGESTSLDGECQKVLGTKNQPKS